MTLTDDELVARSMGGDAESFNQLILRWERPIYALAYRVIGREEDARDVCQETFLRAFRALPGFKGQAKFSSWLYRIALNLCRDWIRRQRRAPVMQMPEGVDPGELAAERGPVESIETLVARRELSAVVEEAMALLPEEQRTAIILKEYHGMTFQEIAEMQGCPLSTVKTRLYQGLTVLRRHLEKNGQMTPQLVKRIMSQTFTCGDPGALVSYLYDECEPHERRAISAHVAVCRACAEELASLGATRELLGAWSPPDAQLGFRVVSDAPPSNVLRPPRWWQQPMPAWAQAAAAAVIFATGLTLGALRGTTAARDRQPAEHAARTRGGGGHARLWRRRR